MSFDRFFGPIDITRASLYNTRFNVVSNPLKTPKYHLFVISYAVSVLFALPLASTSNALYLGVLKQTIE